MLLNAAILKWLFEDYKMVYQYVSIYTLILKNTIESYKRLCFRILSAKIECGFSFSFGYEQEKVPSSII